ncbi:hypothetical protein QJS04_geneDACA013542 [Acorus gramineus]|uniref:Uncharacterized protein n=1 Tax=Acorus gramineus TaxID=55184 RepID=A0AAV9AIA6_ACOGR|nr:hypothetical protein QJS04_geneDACA013542 [Acorus gramineus]
MSNHDYMKHTGRTSSARTALTPSRSMVREVQDCLQRQPLQVALFPPPRPPHRLHSQQQCGQNTSNNSRLPSPFEDDLITPARPPQQFVQNLSPPAVATESRRKKKRQTTTDKTAVRKLSRSILQIGQVYNKVETSKLQQAAEMEKQGMGFVKELELQRVQFFMKTQLELTQTKRQKQS